MPSVFYFVIQKAQPNIQYTPGISAYHFFSVTKRDRFASGRMILYLEMTCRKPLMWWTIYVFISFNDLYISVSLSLHIAHAEHWGSTALTTRTFSTWPWIWLRKYTSVQWGVTKYCIWVQKKRGLKSVLEEHTGKCFKTSKVEAHRVKPERKRKLTYTFIYTVAWLNSSFSSEPLQNSVAPLSSND